MVWGVVPTIVVVTSFVTVGAVAWRMRPHSRVGPLMAAVGVAYLVGYLPAYGRPPVWVLAFVDMWVGALTYLVLGFPTGRLGNWWNRALVTLICGYTLLLGLASVWKVERRSDHLPVFASLMSRQWITFGLSLAVLVVQLVRWRRASVAQRRLIAPVLGSCLVVSCLFAAQGPMPHGFVTYDDTIQYALPLIPIAYLVVLVRRRMDRAGVGGLVVRLGDAPQIVRLVEALAVTLRDPQVRLAFWVPGQDHYVDADGRPAVPDDGQGRVLTRIDRGGRRIAVLEHDRALLDEPDLVEAACAATALALENERLQADLRFRLRELAASRARLVHAVDLGRRQLERDLHDGVQQRLLAVAMLLGRAEHTADQALVTEAKATVLTALDDLRGLCQGIHPPVLTERGLLGALRELVDTIPIPVDLTVDGEPGRLSPEAESAVYYVVAEALSNVVKHAVAEQTTVSVHWRDSDVVVRIGDDGRGGADPAAGSGLAGLADRVDAVGGRLTVTSPIGQGTTVTGSFPYRGTA